MVRNDDDIRYEITKKLGVIAEHFTGWNKELNLVSWNRRDVKYDIRDWDEEHLRMSRGVTLTKDEARKLYELLAAEFGDVDRKE